MKTTTSKPRRKPERTATLINGILKLTVGKEATLYTLRRLPSDFGIAIELHKKAMLKGEDETPVDAEPYHVNLSPENGLHICDCLGFLRHGHCKHVESLLALHQRGKLPTHSERPLAASPARPAAQGEPKVTVRAENAA